MFITTSTFPHPSGFTSAVIWNRTAKARVRAKMPIAVYMKVAPLYFLSRSGLNQVDSNQARKQERASCPAPLVVRQLLYDRLLAPKVVGESYSSTH